MHQYLDAIGFHNVKTKKQLYEILTQVETAFTQHELISQEEGVDFCEFQKEYAPGIGISLCGDMDLDECFMRQYYFPYFIGIISLILLGPASPPTRTWQWRSGSTGTPTWGSARI